MLLRDVLDSFTNDESWFDDKDKIKWIEEMVDEYAKYFGMSRDEMITIMENKRNCAWPSYYQKANFPFPDLSSFGDLVGIYKTFEDFNNYAKEHFKGFKCPKCGTLGSNPQECEHRIKKDGKCDWVSYGFFQSTDGVIILENGFKKIPIFKPVDL